MPRLQPLFLAALGQVEHDEHNVLVAQEVPAEVAVAPVKKNFMEAVSLRTKATTEHFLIGNGMTTENGKKAWLFAKLHPGRARKIVNAT